MLTDIYADAHSSTVSCVRFPSSGANVPPNCFSSIMLHRTQHKGMWDECNGRHIKDFTTWNTSYIWQFHKEHLGNSRMGKRMVFPLWTFSLWNNPLLLKQILTFFPCTRGNCAERECCKCPLCFKLAYICMNHAYKASQAKVSVIQLPSINASY